jgi:PAS domain S-box-containing protein
MQFQEKNKEEDTLDNESYKVILDMVDEGYCLVEMHIKPNKTFDFKFIEINKAFEKQSTLRDVKGKWMRDLRPELEEEWYEMYRDVALTGKAVRMENQAKGLEGKWFSVYVSRIGEPEQHRVAILFSDITQQKKTEEFEKAMRMSEEHLRLALDAVNFGTWEINLETGHVFNSLRHDQIFGYKELQPEWTFEKKLEHVVPEDREMVRKAFEQADEKGGLTLEVRIRWNDGSIHWIFWHGQFHYNNEGKPVRIVGIVSEITERKEMELALKERENRLHELNATKDKFFSIIAHDLKAPYNSILGFSELLIEKTKNKDYHEIEAYASVIQKSAWRAMNLLTNLFVWTKLQTGRMEFHLREKDIVALINEATELLMETAVQKSINIYLFTPDSFPIAIDEYMISTVLRNLISNAIKFTNQNGKITISAIAKEGELEISVIDNGIGIKPDKIEHLFRIDKNISSLGTNGEEGSGLGLTLCQEFVTKHGGKIWAESEPGKGSSFIFTLPTVRLNKEMEGINGSGI